MSHQSLLLQGRKIGSALSRGTPQRKCCFRRVTLVLYLFMWLLGSPEIVIVSVHLANDMKCSFIAEDETFNEINFLHFQLQLFAKETPVYFVCWCKGLHQSRLVQLKHSRLRNTFHTVTFGMSNSLLNVASDLRGLH